MDTFEIKGDKAAVLVRQLTYQGKPVEELSKDELLVALQEVVASFVVGSDEALAAVKEMQAAHSEQIKGWVAAEKIWLRNRDILRNNVKGWETLAKDCIHSPCF